MDVLIVTGPVNRYQLDVPDDAGYRVITVHPTGEDIGSNAMHAAMKAWLDGRDLRSAVEARVGEPVGKIGVVWFSAGHGSVRAILEGDTKASDVCAWICIDGLYGSAAWAIEVASSAMRWETTLLATASTSTPGTYDHSLDRWRFVVERCELPAASPEAATRWGLPTPDEVWASGAALVAGYDHIGHADQVPTMRDGAMRWWNAARAGAIRRPWFSSPSVVGGAIVAGVAAVVGLAAWAVSSRSKRDRTVESQEPMRANLWGDYWIAPDGELITVRLPHDEVAREILLRRASADDRAALDRHGARVEYERRGAIRVAGFAFEVWRLDDSALRRLQGFLESQRVREGVIELEELSRGRFAEADVQTVMASRSAASLWKQTVWVGSPWRG